MRFFRNSTLFILVIFIISSSTLQSKEKISFDAGWKFLKADSVRAKLNSFNDNSWETVNLPHTWNLADGADGGSNYYKGAGWYRKRYSFSEVTAGRRAFIYFESASKAADVYVNGNLAGRHEGGYSAFCFEITKMITPGNDNLIAVRVDNGASLEIAPSLTSDFTQWGGICRKVYLLVTDQICISPLDFASTGVYIIPHQGQISSQSASYKISTLISNGSITTKQCEVSVKVRDATGAIVTIVTNQAAVPGNTSQTIDAEIVIALPHLWNGLKNPYLYTVEVLLNADGNLVDRDVEPLGVRYYYVDPQNGLFLNGGYYDLHGAAMHEDRAGKGRAISDADREQDISLMKEMGVTFIRLAHYQHAPYVYELADKQGIILWTEAPLVNDIVHNDTFKNSIKNMLRELIKQNFNHPSVFFWGLYNELRANSYPDTLVNEMNVISHELDPSRPTTAASNQAKTFNANWIPDLVAWNKYSGWYGGTATDFGPSMDDIHYSFPDRSVGISEYGAGANINHHEAIPVKPITTGQWHPEEYQSLFHEIHWDAMKIRPFIWCKSIWNGFDFAADNRGEGDQPGINDKGMVTRDRSVRKDAYYYYKANWTSDPVVYISSRRFTGRSDSSVYIKVYSNCDSVQYFINLLYQGSVKKESLTDKTVFQLNNVLLKAGINSIMVRGFMNGSVIADNCSWHYSKVVVSEDSIPVISSKAGAEQIPEGNYKYLAYDGNLLTRWAGSATLPSNWITFYLPGKENVGGIKALFYKGDTRTYSIKITVGKTVVFTGTTATSTGYWTKTFPPVYSDSVRIEEVAANSDGNNWLSIYEIAVLKSLSTDVTRIETTSRLILYSAPNPFTNRTNITWKADGKGKTEIVIHDLAGRMIYRTEQFFADDTEQYFIWDGTDQNNSPVEPGCYVVRIKCNNKIRSCKVVKL
jgi:beta-galactosidase